MQLICSSRAMSRSTDIDGIVDPEVNVGGAARVMPQVIATAPSAVETGTAPVRHGPPCPTLAAPRRGSALRGGRSRMASMD